MDDAQIVAAARELIASGGVENLSMRKLAADLGVAPTAIYWHVGGREALLGRVLDQLVAELPPITVRGRRPRERVRSAARGLRRQVDEATLTHQLAEQLGRSAEAALPGQRVLARELSAAELGGQKAADALRSILFLVGGFVLLEGLFSRQALGAIASHVLWQEIDDQAIEPGLLRAMGQPADTEALFHYALDRLLDGIFAAS